MLSCFGGFSRKNSNDEEIPTRSSQQSSTRSSQEPLSAADKVSKFLKSGHLHSKFSTARDRSSSMNSRDSRSSRWTRSSSGADSVRSVGLANRKFYNLNSQETTQNFISSAQVAQQMRQQSDEMSPAGSALTLMSSMSLHPAPSWGMNSWEIDADDVQICLDSRNRPWQLGSGGFGRVFRAEMAGSTPVAVKFVNRQNPRELSRFVHEIGILRSLRHTNIVQFMGAFLEGGQMILVTEYMVGGDLFNVIGHDLQQEFSWYRRGQGVALDVVRGLVHMHARRIIHLDLKSANILLTRDGTAKIADVGLAKVLSRESTMASMQSTFDWAAPEVLAGQTCSDKADIWSLGVVLWEIAAGEAPKLRQLRPLKVPEECPQELKDLVVSCRASDPADRPDAREVFKRLSRIVNQTMSIQSLSTVHSGPMPNPLIQSYMSSLWTANSMQMQQSMGNPLLWSRGSQPEAGGSPNHRPRQPLQRRPSWAGPEHDGEEEAPSFMSAIYENNQLHSQSSNKDLHTDVSSVSLRKCKVDLSSRLPTGMKRRTSRDVQYIDGLAQWRSSSL